MREIEAVNKPYNRGFARKMFGLLIMTLIPLLIAFGVYLSNPDSDILRSVSVVTRDLPVLLSAKNPLLSSVLNAWCKTAPFWALILVLLSLKGYQIKKDQPKDTMIKALTAFSLFYFAIIYMLLLHTTEITQSGRLLRTMSQNDYLLTSLFLMIYAACFVLTVYYLLFLIAAIKTLNKR